jgi:hypothetical protein
MIFWYRHHYTHDLEAGRRQVFTETRLRYPQAEWLEEKADVTKVAGRLHYSWEHTASLIRRKRLLRLRRRIPEAAVVTGHHYSDYLETLALRRDRKIPEASLPALSDVDDVTGFLRPLYNMTREEIRDEVNALGFSFYEDPANEDLKFARNRVRKTHPLSPSLTKRGGKALPLLFPREGGRGDEFIHELRLPFPKWNVLGKAEKARTLFLAFRRLAVVRKFTRNHFSRAHRLPFNLPPFFAHAERISGADWVVFRRGLGQSVSLPEREASDCIRGDAVTRKVTLRKSFGRKSVAKIFSERALSPRQRRRTLVYLAAGSHYEALRIAYPDGSIES